MKTILVPLDGSALSEQVLPYVHMLAPILGARVRLLRVIVDGQSDSMLAESIAATYGVLDPLATQRERERRSFEIMYQNAESYLASQALALRGEGLDIEVDVRCGPAADLIVEAAEGAHVTMIAMATHGYGGLRRWALGSVTDKVVHETSTPVFIVRDAHRAAGGDTALKRIMVPLDGSALAKQALPLATELATCARAELLLMEAVAPTLEAYPGFPPVGRPIPQLSEVLEALRAQAAKELGEAADKLQRREVAATTRVVSGHAAEVIVDEAKQRGVDLIVMATHGYGGLKRWALGSIADKVLHASTTPLVLVRAQAPAEEVQR
jgi:nucleotide-binding universal stress UspA family protein